MRLLGEDLKGNMLGIVKDMMGDAEEDVDRESLDLTDDILKGTHWSLLTVRHWDKLMVQD